MYKNDMPLENLECEVVKRLQAIARAKILTVELLQIIPTIRMEVSFRGESDAANIANQLCDKVSTEIHVISCHVDALQSLYQQTLDMLHIPEIYGPPKFGPDNTGFI